MRRCGVYARISDDRAGEALGVQRQEADGRDLAKRKGWEVVGVYTDNDISATRKGGKKKTRPAFDRLFEDVKNGVIDAVVAWDFDRMFRDPLEQEQFFLMCERRGDVKVATIGDDVDIDSGDGLMVARIKGAVAAEEARKISTRAKRKHLELAAAGLPPGGGTRPFGFLNDRRTIHPEEAELIREACRRLLSGETLYGVCSDFERRGIPTVSGMPWRTQVLKRIVTAGRICGWREHHGELVAVGVFPAIVERDTVERLRAILRDPARTPKRPARRYLLTGGIAVCGACGKALIARPKQNGDRTYTCASGPNFDGCGKIRRLADTLELWVADQIVERIDSPGYAKGVARHDRVLKAEDPLMEIRTCEKKLADLARDWADDKIDRVSWDAARQQTEKRLEAARSQLTLDTAPIPPGSGADLAAKWEVGSFGERRAIVERLIESVTVKPAVKGRNFFDPTAVEIGWRI